MFAEKMKALRLQSHMTQAELAEKLELSPSAVGMYEQGRREPELSVITRLCKIFNVPADTLIGNPLPEQSNEIMDVISDIQSRLLTGGELTLDGTPMSEADVRRLIDAIEVSATVVLSQMDRSAKDPE